MKPSTRTLLDTAWYLLVFLSLQFIATYLAAFIYAVTTGTALQDVLVSLKTGGNGETTDVLLAGSIASNLVTILLFRTTKWTPAALQRAGATSRGTLFYTALFALSLLLPLQWIYEQCGIALPDNLQELFDKITQTPLGYVSIALFAPVAEEMVFRGAVLHALRNRFQGRNTWIAVVVSAALFALVHGNTAQSVNAFAMGIFLGWLCLRTGSIVAGILFHWLNNSMPFVLQAVAAQKADASLADLFGQNSAFILPCVLLSAVIACFALRALHRSTATTTGANATQ